MTKTITIAAAVMLNARNQTLLVRKRGTENFMQPGGKIDEGETPDICLRREVEEELNISLAENALKPLGLHAAQAANELGYVLNAHLFLARTDDPIEPQNEIEEARWVTVEEAQSMQLAPLTRDTVLPLVEAEISRETAP